MLKFFRKIRQNLMVKGDVKRYLFYAIGEILLVVIGILIALQINMWNTAKVDRQAENYFLNQMLIELEGDIGILTKEKDKLQNQLPIIEDLLGLLHQKEVSMEEFNPTMTKYLDAALYAMAFNTNPATFDEMKSSGKLGVISDKALRNQIVQLYNNLESLEQTLTEVNEFGRELAVDLAIHKGLGKYLHYQKATFSKFNTPQELFDMRQHKSSILNHLINQNWTLFEVMPVFESQLMEMHEVVSAVKKHLKTS